MVKIADIHNRMIPIRVVAGRICSPASPAIRKPIATSWMVVFHFAIPFLLLLSRQFKRDAKTLVWLASWLLFMRFVDLFWYIEPNFTQRLSSLSWIHLLDIVVPIAIGGIWFAMFWRNLRSRPLLPVYDLHAQEFLEYVGAAHD